MMMKKPIIFIFLTLLLICIALSVLFIFPEINAFSLSNPVSMKPEITAGDKLAFSGTIISSLITITIVVLSYLTTQKNIQEERRLTISPYIVSSYSICEDYNACKIATEGENKTFYIARPHHAVLLLKNATYPSSNYDLLNEIQKDETEFFKHNFFICYDLANHGAGNAVNVTAFLNEDKLSYPNCTVSLGSKTSFVLVLNEDIFQSKFAQDATEAIIDIRFTYSDINQLGYYEQCERLYLHKYEPTNKLFTSQGSEDHLTSAKLQKKPSRIDK